MKRYANIHRRLFEFGIGDQVMLKLMPKIMKKIKSTEMHRSLVRRHDGPFEVVKKIEAVAYRLKLSERYKLHPTFHVSFLKPFHEDASNPKRLPLLLEPSLPHVSTFFFPNISLV